MDRITQYILKAIEVGKNLANPDLMDAACTTFYRVVRDFIRAPSMEEITSHLNTITNVLLDGDMNIHPWKLFFALLLFEVYMKSGQKEKAAGIFGTALHKCQAVSSLEEMLPLLLRGFEARMEVSNPLVAFLLNTCESQELGVDRAESVSDDNASLVITEENQKIGREQALALQQSEVWCRIRLAVLRKSNKPVKKKTEELKNLVTALNPDEHLSEGSSSEETEQNLDSSKDDQVEIDMELCSFQPMRTEVRFSLLIDMGHLALNWQATSVCEYCLAKCKQILTTKGISDETAAKFAFDLLTLRLGLLRETCRLEHNRESLLEVHKQYLVSGHQLLRNGLENGLDGPNVYTGCVVLWDICIPLFQRPTRQEKQLRDSLNLILKALDQTGSLHYQLLCQTHWMQAQCLADVDQIPQALTHLEQALRYEDTGELRDAILHLRNRLTLRSSLYEIPSKAEDIAGQVLEHLASINPKDLPPNNIKQLFNQTSWSGTASDDKKLAETFSLDVIFKRIGETLAPSTFAKAWEVCMRLEGFGKQNPQHQLTNRRVKRSERGQDTLEQLLWLANNAQIWSDLSLILQQELTNLLAEQPEGFKNAQQRVLLWRDLVTTARRFRMWAVSLLASRYCLLYDQCEVPTGAISSLQTANTLSSKNLLSTRKNAPGTDDGTSTLGSTAKAHLGSPRRKTLGKHPLNIQPGTRNLQELNVLRALAEVNCLYAESLCVLLRGQRPQCHLGGKMHKLHAPLDHLATRIDGQPGLGTAESVSLRVEKQLIEGEKKVEYWKTYCDWLQIVSESAMLAFQRSARISTELRDTQHFQACVVCLWNHCLPAVCAGEHDQLVATFQIILDCGDTLGSKALPLDLHCELASVYAHGSMQPWMPKSDLGLLLLPKNRDTSPTLKTKTPTSKGYKNIASHGKSPERSKVFTLPPEGRRPVQTASDWLIKVAKLVKHAEDDAENNRNRQLLAAQHDTGEMVSQNTRFYLTYTWMVTRQMLLSAPTYKHSFPGDMFHRSNPLAEKTDISAQDISASSARSTISIDSCTGSAITGAMLAVHAIWLTNRSKMLGAWTPMIRNLLNTHPVTVNASEAQQAPPSLPQFRDASLHEATALMERAFHKDVTSHGDIDNPTHAHKPSAPQIRRVTNSDRVVELSLWMKLIRCAIFEQDYNLALQLSDSAHMEHELSRTTSSQCDYHMAAFLNLRGLAVFGLFGLLKMQRSNSQHNKKNQSPSKLVTVGHVKPLMPNFEISDLFGDSIESSMFVAAEEALFNAVKFASRAKRYDLLVSCAEAYWKLCKTPDLTFFASVVQLLHQCVPLKERCKQILDLLVKSIDSDQRAKLNEAIRSESTTPTEGDQPELSDHFEQDLEENALFELIGPSPPTLPQFQRDLKLRTEIYMTLFDVLLLEGKHDDGLSLLSDGLRHFPRTNHRIPLFQRLVLTKGKLGLPVQLEMQKFSNQPQQVQAEIWRSLAYESRSKQDQILAFRSAIDVLKSSDYDQMKAELLMEFAQWLMSNRMDTRNCITLLEHAIDLLLTTGNSQGSANLLEAQTEQVGRTRKPVKTSVRQKGRPPVREQDKTQSSARVSGDPNVLFSIGDSKDIRRLDALLRAFVLLADILQIAGQHVPENNWLPYTLLAVACVRQIWTVALTSTKKASQYLQKTQTSSNEDTKAPKKPRNQSKQVAMDFAEHIPSDSVPSTLHDWVAFEVSNDTLRVWQKVYEIWQANCNVSQHKNQAVPPLNEEKSEMLTATEEFVRQQINPYTFPSPFTTVSSLTRLADLVTEVGLTHLALPVLTLQLCLTSTTISTESTADLITRTPSGSQLARLKLLEVCCSLNSSRGVDHHKSQLGSVVPDETEVFRLLRLQNSTGGNLFLDYVVENWLQLAHRLAKLSQGMATRIFLETAERFASKSVHKITLLYVKATLAFVEGQYQLSRDLLAESTKLDPSDENFWLACTILRMDTLSADPNLAARHLPGANVFLGLESSLERRITTHFGQQAVLEELKATEAQLTRRSDAWPFRAGWYAYQRGLLLARQGELEARLDESNHQLTQIYFQPKDIQSTSAFLGRSSGAPAKFLEAMELFSAVGRTRCAVRLARLPLAVYWKRCFEAEVASYISALPNRLIHPSFCCNCFGNALDAAQDCLNQAVELVTQVESSCTQKELSGCSFPVHRDLIDTKFVLVGIHLAMMRADAAYERSRLEQFKQKDPLARAVDVFVTSTGDDVSSETDQQTRWKRSVAVAFDCILTLISEVLGISERLPIYGLKCMLYIGEALKLKGDLLLPDDPHSMRLPDEFNSAGAALPTQDKTPTEDCPITPEMLHSGYRWRSRKDVLTDIKQHESYLEMYAQASRILLGVLAEAIAHNLLGIAKYAAELLLQCVGGTRVADAAITTSLLHGYQSCAAACRSRTHLALATLGRKLLGSRRINNLSTKFGYVTSGVASRTEVILRQLIWLCPSSASPLESVPFVYGFCSGIEPNSCAETLAWVSGLRTILLNSRFASSGGLSAGPDDHCSAISPWSCNLMDTLISTSKIWGRTVVQASVIFDPLKTLSEALLSVPGMDSQMASGWQLFLMEHSSDCSVLYVSFPKQLGKSARVGRADDTRKSPNKEPEYIHCKIPTSRPEIMRTVWSWKCSVAWDDARLGTFLDNSELYDMLQNSACLQRLLHHISVLWSKEVPTAEKEDKVKERKSGSKVKREKSKSPSKTSNKGKVVSPTQPSHSTDRSSLPQNGVVLMADSWLLELPLEALLMRSMKEGAKRQLSSGYLPSSISQDNPSTVDQLELTEAAANIPLLGWITRDFSYQAVHTRLFLQQKEQKSENAPHNQEKGATKTSGGSAQPAENLARKKETKTSRQLLQTT
ncbi:TPR repeat-containing protein C10orf93 [Clonorchis sinensis]|uniref:TPR repeat-containing protein C10orf93 n=1 Tax=Clonorchis sinensis TaxID=79923 RepID=G7YG66_CLOSI|nr:TPR repeat-containing protein C10orf93 [Clonorchis sinensis]